MAEGDIKPPATLGKDHSPRPKKKSKAPLIIGGIVVIGGLVYFFILRKKSSTSSTTSTSSNVKPVTLSPASRMVAATTGPTGQSIYSGLFNQMNTLSQQFSSLRTQVETAINSKTANTNPGTTKQTIPSGQTSNSTPHPGATRHPTTTNTLTGTNLQRAPTYNVFGSKGTIYTPASYSQTISSLEGGQGAYFKTGTTAFPIKNATQFKAIEHTGTRKFTQYTSYVKA